MCIFIADGVVTELIEVMCVFCYRFIIGKEELPSHSVVAEHTHTRPHERTAAVETDDAQASAERPDPRRKTLVAYTRELLESM